MPFDYQPLLKGALVELRPLRADDHARLYAVASDPQIWEQHPDKTRHQPEGFSAFFRESLASGGALLVSDSATGRVIGSSRFFGHDEARSEVEIGWTFLARSHWGGAYNGDLKQLMMRHAFRFVDSVVLFVSPENLRSQRAVAKIGGVLENEPDAAGRLVYRVTASSFRERECLSGGELKTRYDGLVLMGPPGSGKSFLGNHLASHGVAAYTELEPVLARRFGTGEAFESRLREAGKFIWQSYTQQLSSSLIPVAFESTGVSDRSLLESLQRHYRVALVHVRATRQLCVDRLLLRPRGRNISNSDDPQVLGRLYDLWYDKVASQYRFALEVDGGCAASATQGLRRFLTPPHSTFPPDEARPRRTAGPRADASATRCSSA